MKKELSPEQKRFITDRRFVLQRLFDEVNPVVQDKVYLNSHKEMAKQLEAEQTRVFIQDRFLLITWGLEAIAEAAPGVLPKSRMAKAQKISKLAHDGLNKAFSISEKEQSAIWQLNYELGYLLSKLGKV